MVTLMDCWKGLEGVFVWVIRDEIYKVTINLLLRLWYEFYYIWTH